MNNQSTYRFCDSPLILTSNVGSISKYLLQTAGAEDACESKRTGDLREQI